MPQWTVSEFVKSASGFTATIDLANPGAGTFGPALNQLALSAVFETDSRVHIRLIDPNNTRYEIPQSVLPYPALGSKHMPLAGQKGSYDFADALYTVNIAPEGQAFTLTVVRNSDSVVLFDLGDLEYSDQYLQMSTLLPEAGAPLLYGLGEHVMTFELPTDEHTFTMWNVDIPTPYDQNIYGSATRRTGTNATHR